MIQSHEHEDNGKVTRNEWVFLAVAFLIALIVRQMIHVRLFPDSIDYLTFARNIFSGIHHTGGITLNCYRRPPLYPHLVALFSLGSSSPAYLADVGRQISVFGGALLVFPLYFLGRRMLGKTAAAAAVLMVVITPEFLYYSGAVLTESLCTLFVTTSMFILWRFSSKKKGHVRLLLLGFLLGLTFLTRHAAVGYLGIALVWVVFSRLIMKGPTNSAVPVKWRGIQVLIILAGFFLAVSPQVLYLHSETGRWALVVDSSSPARWLPHAGENIHYTKTYESVSSLTPDAELYLWEAEESPGLLSIIAKEPSRYANAYVATLWTGYFPDTYPLPYPTIILIFALLGIIGLAKEKKFRELLFSIWGFGGYYLFLALFLNMRDRYMFPSYPFLLLTAGAGLATAVKLPSYFVRGGAQNAKVRWAAKVLLFGLMAGFLLSASAVLIKKQNSMANTEFFERLGRDLSKIIEKNAVMFDRTPHLAYFSGGIKASPPYAEIDKVLHFARKRGVDYWVVSSSYVPGLRPQYLPLLNPKKNHKGLKPEAAYSGKRGFIIVVYRILPEGQNIPPSHNQ